ncbi:hypothetical protein [Streptomyces sp. NPDC048650]|uniref:hypothetical protein n=1 Tax=unclassified Streptomyces TaxID=2593676 RepID=UPI00371A135B
MDFDDEDLPITLNATWWHASVAFPGGAVNPAAAQVLSAALHDQRFRFLCKGSGLRLRTERPCAALLDRLVAEQQATGWVGGIYEPEIDAFGGPRAWTWRTTCSAPTAEAPCPRPAAPAPASAA